MWYLQIQDLHWISMRLSPNVPTCNKIRSTDTYITLFQHREHSVSTYAKFSKKTNISYPLMRTHTCAYQGVRKVSFLENNTYTVNGWSHHQHGIANYHHKIVSRCNYFCKKASRRQYWVTLLCNATSLMKVSFFDDEGVEKRTLQRSFTN